jgi:hypothetical protein
MACRKINAPNEAAQKKSTEFRQFITANAKKFKLVEYYSDIPIDYDPKDSIKEKETALWRYVQDHVTDDHDTFLADGTVLIEQNEKKIPLNDSTILTRQFKTGVEGIDAYFDFVDYYYKPLRYYIDEISSNYFLIHVKRENAKVFSKFSSTE